MFAASGCSGHFLPRHKTEGWNTSELDFICSEIRPSSNIGRTHVYALKLVFVTALVHCSHIHQFLRIKAFGWCSEELLAFLQLTGFIVWFMGQRSRFT